MDALIGLVGLGVVVALVLGVVAVYEQTFTERVRLEARTGSVGNALRVGSDVKVRGVPVGRVESISATSDGAVLGLAIDPAYADEIPADSSVRLLPKTLFGERYVALQVPGGAVADPIADGDSLSEDTSREAVELQEVLDDLLPVLRAVQPEKVSAMLGELAAFLRGQGASIGDTTVLAARYLGELNPMVPQLADDLAALGRVADDYSVAAPDLLAAFDDLAVTAGTLVDERTRLRRSLARVTGAADEAEGFVSGNESTIVVLSRESRRALAVVRPYARSFPCVFAALRDFVPEMDRALGAGTDQPGLHADVSVVAARGGYGQGDQARLQTRGPARCPAGAPERTPTGARELASDAPLAIVLGQPNSPQENAVVAELLAPARGVEADDFPAWGSLLLGPLLRDTEAELR